MTRRVLLCLDRDEDIELARVVIQTVEGAATPTLLFGSDLLRQRFGPTSRPSLRDATGCLANPHGFNLVVAFASADEPSFSATQLLLCYFDEIGVACAEIPRSLFQARFHCLPGYQPPAAFDRPAELVSRLASPSRRLVSWTGPEGIGHPRSAALASEGTLARRDLVVVTSAFDWPQYSEKHEYQFAIAVLRLAQEQPGTTFVWRPRGGELRAGELRGAMAVLEAYKVPNLRFELADDIETLLALCAGVISMVSPWTVDLHLARKPALLFESPETEPMRALFALVGFRDAFGLQALWSRYTAQPQQLLLTSELGVFQPDVLRRILLEAAATTELRTDFRAAALRYSGFMREHEILRQLGSLHERQEAQEKKVRSLGAASTKLLERLTVLQRSTLAYKAKKLVARVRRG